MLATIILIFAIFRLITVYVIDKVIRFTGEAEYQHHPILAAIPWICGFVLPVIPECMMLGLSWYWMFLINAVSVFLLGIPLAWFYITLTESVNIGVSFIVAIVALIIGIVLWKPMINGHKYVDLGLSIKWATCNVGADKPEDYGDYYAWGETVTKLRYGRDNSEAYEQSIGDVGNTSRDVAYVKWGGTWRMPTKAEIDELINNCDYVWINQNGVEGCRFTSRKNGKSIFFPAAGRRDEISRYNAGSDGNYWSSTPDESDTHLAYYLYFGSGDYDWGEAMRYRGYTVRPVSE